MWKRIIIPMGFAACFVICTAIFWYLIRGFYDSPFTWTRFNNDFNFSLIPVGFCLVFMIFFSSLLTLVKSHSKLVYGVYIIAAATFAVFLPITAITVLAAILFSIGFIFYEWSTNKLFHSFIKIDFWDTYTKTIPTLITFLTVVICLVGLQASIDKLNQLKISIPKGIIEKAFTTITDDDKPPSGGVEVKGTSTVLAATEVDSPEVTDLINKQLIQFGITDPAQQEIYREQIKQQLGVAPKQTTASAGLSAVLNPMAGIEQVRQSYKDQLVNQLKGQLEEQLNQLLDRYSEYIPMINAFALFFLISILNIPVMLLSIGLVVATMDLLRFLKIITVVKVKTDVEHFAW